MSKKCLVVDDHAPFREFLANLLVKHDMEVLEASDGGEAIRWYAANLPDCVVMDMHMKPVDGLVATRRITSAFPQALVIILTDHEDPALRELAYQAGATHCLSKDQALVLPALLAQSPVPRPGAGRRPPPPSPRV